KAGEDLEDPRRGILFTNATGTGKTYTGLGIIKRLVLDGKADVLIVVPTDQKAKDWIEDAQNLDLDVAQLESTKDSGEGVVVTTYANMGQNNALLYDRTFDLVVYDESHRLMQNADGSDTSANQAHLQLTNHPKHAVRRVANSDPETRAALERVEEARGEMRKLHPRERIEQSPLWRERTAELEAAQEAYAPLYRARVADDAVQAEAAEAIERTRAVFLSATPFAYHKTLQYADGYLFTSPVDADRQGEYNQAQHFDLFLQRHLAYYMKTGRLNAPPPDVDTSLMERELHERFRNAGAISGRALELEQDYSRDFYQIESRVGEQIDDGLDFLWLRRDDYDAYGPAIRSHFSYLYKTQLLESIKARESIERVRQHLAMGRKVVVFHSYNENSPGHPFRITARQALEGRSADMTRQDYEKLRQQIERFKTERPDLWNLDLSGLEPVQDVYRKAFGDRVAMFNGTVSKRLRAGHVREFNEDGSGLDVLVVQMEAGKEGISLHDTTGGHQRVMMNLGLPTRPTDAIQSEGRVYRFGNKSDAIFEYPVTGLTFEQETFANKVASRSTTAENLALGNEARALQVAFTDGYMHATDQAPGPHQGTGGKEADRFVDESTPFDKAKTLYYARGKTSKRNKGRDGVDYYATPEPIGLMMVEWLQLGRGDRFLEPSAGHGAIARFVPEGTSSLLIEPSYRLAGQLRLNTSAPVQQSRFEDLHLVNKFEGIAMNPPYGTGGKTAMEHVAKAAKHLAPGGRLIAIVPDGPSMAKRLDTWMESKEGERVVKVADVGLPSVTFKNAATSVRTRIVVFDRPWSQEDRVMIETRGTRDLAADTIEELFDRIENVTMPKRRPKPPEPEASGEFEFETTAPSGDASVGAYRDVSADTPVVPTPEASGVLLAPNGKPSNLNPLQYQLVRTPAFKDWFGDWENDPENASKVLNENGEPAVVYHGTSGNFDLFSEQSRRGTGVRRTERIAYYFTSSPAVANSFADRSALFDPGDANVMPVFLSLKRPEIVDADGASIDDLEQPLSESGDGVLIRNVHDYHSEFAIGKPESTVYAAFGASQIKSATGNSGGFSAASPNINASVGTYRDVAPAASGAAPASRAPATLTVTIDGRTYSQELGGLDAVKSVEMPELVRIARSLMGDVPHMGTGRMDANGLFRTRGVDVPSGAAQDVDARGGAKKAVAQVRIQPELFRNTTMAAQVLAHEIGHLVDFVPDETMKRGNLGGRLRSLLGYMKSTVERSDGRSGSVLTSKDRSKLRREARKAVLDREGIRPKDYAADAATRQRLADPIAAEYQSRVSAEVKSRNLVDVGTLTEELWAFSSYWRPVPAGADETYMRYRKSSRELYADALSGLLIAPSELQSRAPTFYQAFFEGLAADKPEVQKVYEEVQLLLARGPEAIAQSRMEDVYGMFEDADRRKALLEEAADAERKQEYRTQLVQSLVTRWHPILERAKRLEKKGTPLAEDPRYLLEEVGMADSPASVYLADVAETVLQPLKAAGLTERDLATWMFLNRVEKEREVRLAEDKLPKEVIEALTGTGLLTRDVQAAELEDLPEEIRAIVQAAAVDTGGRSNMANPLGFTEETARATREHLEAMVGEDGARALRRAQRVFVDLTTPILDEAADLGVLNKEWWETAGKPNRYAYATFRVLDFVGEAHRASVGVKQQRGTFRDVDDVFAATMGKALATIRENVRQRAKLAVKDMMAAHFADEWERPRASGPGRYAPPKNRTLRGVLYIWENGRQRPYYTDRYVADSFRQMDLRGLRWLAATMRFLNAPFRAGFITYNLTFGLWTNPIRDARRVAKALAIKGKKASYRQVIQRYATESKAAWAYARGRVSDPRVRELLASGAMMPPGESVMFVDRGDGLRKTAERYGMAPPAKRGRLLSMVSRLGSSVRLVNRFTEALPKFAAWKILQEQGIDGRERAWRVRTQVGTPNVTDGGRAKELTNSVFMFSNVFTQGWRSDAMLATRPETRGGFVFRTIVLDVVPKLVMKAAQAGLLATATAAVLGVGEDDEENNFGAWLKTFYSHVGRYDMGSYMVIPLGYAEDASSPSGKKARYLRVPHDESSRAVVGALWRLFDDEPDAVAAMASAFDFGGGQVPGFAPAIGLGSTWADYLGGANPRDDFYGRDVISRRAHEARQAGDHGPALAEMTGHTVDEFGVTRFQWRDKSGVNAVPFLNRVVKETSWGLIEEDREQEDREAGRKASVRAAYDMETQARYREMYRLRRDGAEERERHGTSELYQRLLDWHREAYRYYDELANEARTHDDTEGERQARRALEAATREYFGDL
ncbi:MAG: DEAD/DEAH box helicase family protein, partial [Bacteroidota bacterium]